MKKLRIGALHFASASPMSRRRSLPHGADNLLYHAGTAPWKAVRWFLLRWLYHWTGRRRPRMVLAAGGGL